MPTRQKTMKRIPTVEERINTRELKQFREIFGLEARQFEGHIDKRIDQASLLRIFDIIDFRPNEK